MAGQYDIVIEQGATFKRRLTWKDSDDQAINLTSFTAAMQVRSEPLASDPMISLTEGAGITLGGAAGTIDILIAASDTDDLDPGEWYYDLELTSSGGETTRLIQGKATVSEQVTR